MNKLLPFLGVLSGFNAFWDTAKEQDELENIDIDAEYFKIQQKKSNLSRRLRDEVIFRYNQKKKEKQKA